MEECKVFIGISIITVICIAVAAVETVIVVIIDGMIVIEVEAMANVGAAECGEGGEMVGAGEDVDDAHEDAGSYEF